MGRRREDPDRIHVGELSATPMRERGERPGNVRYWRIRHLPTGQTVGSGWWTRDEASAAVAEACRRPIPSRPSARAVAGTVGDLLDRWAAVQGERVAAGELAPLSLRNYRLACRWWKSALADVKVQHLTRELAEDTLRSWRARTEGSMAPRTARLAADVLVSVVAWGAPRGRCPAVALDDLPSARVDHEEHRNNSRTPTRDESDRVLNMIPAGRDRDVVELLSLTGARVGEVAAMTVASYDREHAVLYISGRDRARSRRGKVATRAFPVVGSLGALLERLVDGREAGEPMVAGLPGHVACSTSAALERGCRAAGVEVYTPHGLRRMVATELMDQSANDAKSVSKLTGHSVAILLRDYVRPGEERLREIVARAARRGRVLRVVGTEEDEGGE